MLLTFEYIVLSFESEDKILRCYNSNETCMYASTFTFLLIFFFHIVQILTKINFGILPTLGVKGSHVTGEVDALLQRTSMTDTFFFSRCLWLSIRLAPL